jgi:hypothetical protein
MTQFSDNLFVGAGGALYQQQAGLQVPPLVVQQFGQVKTASASGLAGKTTASGTAGVITLNGTYVSGGVATLDVPRNISLTSTANLSAKSFTIVGTDILNRVTTQTRSGPNNTTVYTLKAFKTVTSVTATGTVTGGVKVGNGTGLGLSANLANLGCVLGQFHNGITATGATWAVGMTATQTSTATTADPRGTVTPNTAPNGTIWFTAMYVGNPATNFSIYGPNPA